MTDLPAGYRWATEEESELWRDISGARIITRTVDSQGQPYTQGEADIAVPITPSPATNLLLKALKDAWSCETSFQFWRAVLERAQPDLDEFAKRRSLEIGNVAPHGCGLCDAPLQYDGTDYEGYRQWSCTRCDWQHTSRDCCDPDAETQARAAAARIDDLRWRG